VAEGKGILEMKKIILAAVLMVATSPAALAEYRWVEPDESAREAKQQRYEELLHARYDMYVREFNADRARGDAAIERGEYEAARVFYDDAREDRRKADEMSRMLLESQKPTQ
jgi:hypothetical protein